MRYPRIPTLLLAVALAAGCGSRELQTVESAKLRFMEEGAAEAWQALVTALQRGDAQSGAAALALGKTEDRRATPFLVRELLNQGPAAKEALDALAMLKDPRSVPALIRVVRENRPYAERAVQILGDIGDPRAVPALVEAVRERKPYYLAAVATLGRIGDPRAVPTLLEFFGAPAPHEADQVQIRIQHQDGTEDWAHTRTFEVANSQTLLPPRVQILDYHVEPDSRVTIDYQLFDDNLDSLRLVPEFSLNAGRTWAPALVEGPVLGMTSARYRGTLVWEAGQANIPITAQTSLVFRVTPADRPGAVPNGAPAVLPIPLNLLPIGLRDVAIEVGDSVQMAFYHGTAITSPTEEFVYQYSPDDGRSWLHATIVPITPAAGAPPDTQFFHWVSQADLPAFDSDRVRFRLSTSQGKRIGMQVVTSPFHLDNNAAPRARITGIDDRDLVDVSYVIDDPEQDTVRLVVEFSKTRGASWERATVSGAMAGLGPAQYRGRLRWFADFDIPELKTEPVRLRFSASDADAGPIAETPDFFLKESYFAPLSSGRQPGDIALAYSYGEADSTRPAVQYSLDGGRTWQDATITGWDRTPVDSRTENRVNWRVQEDLRLPMARQQVFAQALNAFEDPGIVPTLLTYEMDRDSPTPALRARAVQATQVLDARPRWVVQGLIQALADDRLPVHRRAAELLATVETEEVRQALSAYQTYWALVDRTERERRASQQEAAFYAGQVTALRRHRADREQLISFMKTQAMSDVAARRFVDQLDMFKFEKVQAARRDRGEITEQEYQALVNDEIRRRAEAAEAAETRR